ncbi:MAG: hypothetical protein ACRC3Y_04665 [Romboutsia sp.]|uniref:hypothetical protein n=1 Tax=Romboutsia sp. TaxID=1965302 RepID=UPI003F2B0CFB
MYSSIDEIKKELKNLCNEYIDILEKLKEENIITKETFEVCSSNKISFLEK